MKRKINRNMSPEHGNIIVGYGFFNELVVANVHCASKEKVWIVVYTVISET